MFAPPLDPAAWARWRQAVRSADLRQAEDALAREKLEAEDLAALLSPPASQLLEPMAQRAAALTRRRFGRTVVLYVPLYLSNACVNRCTYCGFRQDREIPRRTLDLEELEREVARLKQERFDHVLLLTGEDRRAAPLDYLRQAVALCRGRFSSVGVEIYPLDETGYRTLVDAGCDSLTLYQETYDPRTYARVHPRGPKANYDERLTAPTRAAAAGMRSVGLGALLGLADWRTEAVFLGLHGRALKRSAWRCRVSIGFPRLRGEPGAGLPLQAPAPAELAQMIFALRLFLPDADLVLSTREPQAFRDGLAGVAITRMSAGSRTSPGAYAHDGLAGAQFDVTDQRSPAEVAATLGALGLEPVWKDFDRGFLA